MPLSNRLIHVALIGALVPVCAAPTGSDDATGASTSAATTDQAGCPGAGWSAPDTSQGIEGTYLRGGLDAPLDEMTALTLLEDPPANAIPSVPYWRTLASGAVQFGKAIVAIPAPAPQDAIVFVRQDGSTLDVYAVLGLVRSPATGQVQDLCLEDGTTGGEPFAMSRIGP